MSSSSPLSLAQRQAALEERMIQAEQNLQQLTIWMSMFLDNLSELKDGGVSPASKAAIAALRVVKVSAGEEEEECCICLREYGGTGGEEVKEMPCKHTYHSGCIEKWLGIHGSCPVCRYEISGINGKRRESGASMDD